ncbi:hypothetical protein L7F22_057907 [Adiantum nelumboides]|nr:hypothetical protein [Adiantum nelumboides]
MRDNRRRARKEAIRAAALGQNKKQGKQQANGAAANGTDADKRALNNRAPALLVNDPSGKGNQGASSAGAAKQQGDLAFSALDFGSLDKAKSRHALPSDPKVALAMLEARKRKEEKRAEKAGGDQDGDEAKERKERERWSKAEAAAQGVKIRDDEALLKKAAKKRDKVKDKSRKAWQDREKEQRDQQAARQKKRQENIASKKDRGKKSKKTGGAKGGGGKKGTKARPGFEGKSTFGRAGKAGSVRKHK